MIPFLTMILFLLFGLIFVSMIFVVIHIAQETPDEGWHREERRLRLFRRARQRPDNWDKIHRFHQIIFIGGLIITTLLLFSSIQGIAAR